MPFEYGKNAAFPFLSQYRQEALLIRQEGE
jgi:hypothetical protein